MAPCSHQWPRHQPIAVPAVHRSHDRGSGLFPEQDAKVVASEQLPLTVNVVTEVLGGSAVDIIVDDGLRAIETFILTAEVLVPLLAPKYV